MEFEECKGVAEILTEKLKGIETVHGKVDMAIPFPIVSDAGYSVFHNLWQRNGDINLAAHHSRAKEFEIQVIFLYHQGSKIGIRYSECSLELDVAALSKG